MSKTVHFTPSLLLRLPFWNDSVVVPPGGYRSNYFFWLFHVGWVFLFLGATLLFPPYVAGWTLFVPLGVVGVYLLGYPIIRAHPGPAALWLSLVGAVTVGTTCVGHFRGGFDRVTWGWTLLDSLSVPFVFLTVSLAPLVVIASLDSVRKDQFVYYGMVLTLFGVLVLCFCVTHFLVFYVLFEVLGFPMFLLVGLYGPRAQRVDAAYKFYIYTFGGSAFILPVLLFLYAELGGTHFHFLSLYQFTELEQAVLFGLVTVPFAVKVPVMPVHLWLPEAHVEAPTPVSMVLAALLLKTGGYAFLRFIIPVFPFGVYTWGPIINTVGILSIFLGSLYALVQVDLKRMIAYASVAHMSLVFVALFTGVAYSVQGGVYLMLAHGYISAGLFAGIGVLYDRYHTRTIRYLGGLATCMPLFAIGFFVLTLGNLSFPFTGGFSGEFMILLGLVQKNVTVALACGTTVFLSLCYSAWLYNRVFYGVVNPHVQKHEDTTPVEVAVVVWCSIFTVVLGFLGGTFTEYTHDCYTELVNPVSFK